MPFKPIKSLKDEELVIDLINRYRVIASSDDASIKQKLHALARAEYLAGFTDADPGEAAAEPLPPPSSEEAEEPAEPEEVEESPASFPVDALPPMTKVGTSDFENI